MKPDLRISIKDFQRQMNLEIYLCRTPFGTRPFFLRMNGERLSVSASRRLKCFTTEEQSAEAPGR